jgi:hypothetical protein
VDYHVTCGCGKSLAVSAGSAGSRLPCPCGRTIEVPSLRELRRQHGEAVIVNPVLEIEHLAAADGLPATGPCIRCGRDDAATAIVTAECERSWVRKPGRLELILSFLLRSPVLLLAHLWERQTAPADVLGRDVVLRLPLRLCLACLSEVRTQADFAKVLREVPVYARLLDRYPEAILSIAAEKSA